MDKLVFAILFLSGASSMEELSESEIERYYSLSRNPVEINLCPYSKLEDSGLMSPYQCASLKDYIERNGDVLSLKELSNVDGFNDKYCAALEPFISFLSSSVPGGQSRGHRISNEFIAKTSLKFSGGALDDSYALKYRISDRNRWSIAASYKDELSVSMVYYGRNHLRKLILGDFNARYGQGLALWSGFYLKYPTNSTSFEKRGGGLSAVWTWSPRSVNRGAALSLGFGRMSVDLAAVIGGGLIGNAHWRFRKAETGILLRYGPDKSASLYARAMAGKLKMWSELSMSDSGALKAVVGVGSKDGMNENWAFMGSLNPLCISGVWTRGGLDLLSVVGEKNMRFSTKYSWVLGEKFSLTPRLCYKRTWTEPFRLEARLDLDFTSGISVAALRADYVRKKAGAWHARAEYGLKGEWWNCFLRFSLFDVSDWEDRIYVYERDVPGSFSVPAYYGRGYAVALVSTIKRGKSRISLRLSTNSYRDKPDKTEVKIQYGLDL